MSPYMGYIDIWDILTRNSLDLYSSRGCIGPAGRSSRAEAVTDCGVLRIYLWPCWVRMARADNDSMGILPKYSNLGSRSSPL